MSLERQCESTPWKHVQPRGPYVDPHHELAGAVYRTNVRNAPHPMHELSMKPLEKQYDRQAFGSMNGRG